MSTRATYTWIPVGKPEVTFYIHHDGYLEGAVMYMETAMHRAYKNHTHPIEEFGYLQGCEYSEKDVHGDTEYHYTMYFPPNDARLYVKWENMVDGRWKVMGDLPFGQFYRRYANET